MNLDKIDNDYKIIVDDILNDKEFNLLRTIEHHGITRFDHSLKVSYYAYKISKKLKLDYVKVARAGLLHDFFITSNDVNITERIKNTFTHNNIAVNNANRFGISMLEEDIIKSHMFPVNISVPKYAESWVVNFVDKGVAIKEFTHKFSYKMNYASNFLFIFLINLIKL